MCRFTIMIILVQIRTLKESLRCIVVGIFFVGLPLLFTAKNKINEIRSVWLTEQLRVNITLSQTIHHRGIYTYSRHFITFWVNGFDGSAHTNLPGAWKLLGKRMKAVIYPQDTVSLDGVSFQCVSLIINCRVSWTCRDCFLVTD